MAIAPLPPCPLPAEVLESLRKIPNGSLPLLSRPVDLDTVDQTALSHWQALNKSPGSDGVPRELYKYGPSSLRVLLWRAFNAYLRGEIPSVCAHEWLGAIASSIPKQQAALLVTEFRPIACICAKYSILLKILDVRLNHTIEDNCIILHYRWCTRGLPPRSKHQTPANKIHSILHHQRKKQESLSAILYLDIKHAFNAINHQAIFSIFEAAASLRPILPSFEECRRDPS